MDETIPSKVEQSIINQVDRLIPSTDRTLNSIVKLALLQNDSPEYDANLNRVMKKIKQNNSIENTAIKQEFFLTYDCGGNIIEVNNIDEGKTDK